MNAAGAQGRPAMPAAAANSAQTDASDTRSLRSGFTRHFSRSSDTVATATTLRARRRGQDTRELDILARELEQERMYSQASGDTASLAESIRHAGIGSRTASPYGATPMNMSTSSLVRGSMINAYIAGTRTPGSESIPSSPIGASVPSFLPETQYTAVFGLPEGMFVGVNDSPYPAMQRPLNAIDFDPLGTARLPRAMGMRASAPLSPGMRRGETRRRQAPGRMPASAFSSTTNLPALNESAPLDISDVNDENLEQPAVPIHSKAKQPASPSTMRPPAAKAAVPPSVSTSSSLAGGAAAARPAAPATPKHEINRVNTTPSKKPYATRTPETPRRSFYNIGHGNNSLASFFSGRNRKKGGEVPPVPTVPAAHRPQSAAATPTRPGPAASKPAAPKETPKSQKGGFFKWFSSKGSKKPKAQPQPAPTKSTDTRRPGLHSAQSSPALRQGSLPPVQKSPALSKAQLPRAEDTSTLQEPPSFLTSADTSRTDSQIESSLVERSDLQNKTVPEETRLPPPSDTTTPAGAQVATPIAAAPVLAAAYASDEPHVPIQKSDAHTGVPTTNNSYTKSETAPTPSNSQAVEVPNVPVLIPLSNYQDQYAQDASNSAYNDNFYSQSLPVSSTRDSVLAPPIFSMPYATGLNAPLSASSSASMRDQLYGGTVSQSDLYPSSTPIDAQGEGEARYEPHFQPESEPEPEPEGGEDPDDSLVTAKTHAFTQQYHFEPLAPIATVSPFITDGNLPGFESEARPLSSDQLFSTPASQRLNEEAPVARQSLFSSNSENTDQRLSHLGNILDSYSDSPQNSPTGPRRSSRAPHRYPFEAPYLGSPTKTMSVHGEALGENTELTPTGPTRTAGRSSLAATASASAMPRSGESHGLAPPLNWNGSEWNNSSTPIAL
ncbi:hypothetical protein MCUN1_000297 [Malassezia cuniculi]|uniref:Uncharacterized protein n=1 Tax=Malassezia cuniculi TaxID=948313 RepID=A0AAF0EQS6_9BASI|nr:hypothetical protein MCUN1_000297 [Malassezia cuniculi]